MGNSEKSVISNSSELTEKQWSSKQLRVMEALGNPDDGRTEGEIALDMKISQRTLTRWKRIKGFMDAVNDMLDAQKRHARPSVWKQTVRQAKGQSSRDRNLYMKAVGDIDDRSNVAGDVTLKIEWGQDSIEKNKDK